MRDLFDEFMDELRKRQREGTVDGDASPAESERNRAVDDTGSTPAARDGTPDDATPPDDAPPPDDVPSLERLRLERERERAQRERSTSSGRGTGGRGRVGGPNDGGGFRSRVGSAGRR